MFERLRLAGSLLPLLCFAIPLRPSQAMTVTDALASIGQVLAGDSDSSGTLQVRIEGSGVVVGSNGVVVTNSHVVSEGGRFYSSIYFNLVDPKQPYAAPNRSNLYKAEIIMKNQEQDLVLLRLVADADGNTLAPSKTFQAIAIGESKSLTFLDEIYAVGFPKAGGSTVTITRGQISGKEELEDWIKTDAQVTHGNSGGAAVDKTGKLIGIPTNVRPDLQPVDTDHDGFPDTNVSFGSVGLIRPVEIVSKMLEAVREGKQTLQASEDQERIQIKGLVVTGSGESVAKALVGLLKPGSEQASVENLLTWARADENGIFNFPLSIPPGEYALRARASGFETYLQNIRLDNENHSLLIRLNPAGK